MPNSDNTEGKYNWIIYLGMILFVVFLLVIGSSTANYSNVQIGAQPPNTYECEDEYDACATYADSLCEQCTTNYGRSDSCSEEVVYELHAKIL